MVSKLGIEEGTPQAGRLQESSVREEQHLWVASGCQHLSTGFDMSFNKTVGINDKHLIERAEAICAELAVAREPDTITYLCLAETPQ